MPKGEKPAFKGQLTNPQTKKQIGTIVLWRRGYDNTNRPNYTGIIQIDEEKVRVALWDCLYAKNRREKTA